MPVHDTYYGLIERGKTCLDGLVADESALAAFSKCHSFQDDFTKLSDVVSERPETQVFLLAQREYQYALYALSIGNYRHAFISLRLFFELSLAGVNFSGHELSLRRWLACLDDIVWSKIIDENSGIYSDSFIRPFDKEFAALGKQYRTMAEKVYRECSEYVHGNVHTHPELDEPLKFNRELTIVWAEKADTIRGCIVFSFAARFLNILAVESRNALEPIMLEVLGEIPAVQAYYQIS